MNLDYSLVIRMISQVIWPMARIGGVLLTVPVFSSNLVPTRIKIFLLMAMSWVCAHMVSPDLSFLNFNGYYLAYMIQDLFFGLLMGFILQLVFQVFILGGQIIAMQAGMGFAMMVDPTSRASVPIIGQLYSMMITLLFLALNGHLMVIEMLMSSFKIMPIGQMNIDQSLVWHVILFSSWMFKQALLISIPALLSLLIVSLAFGVMARAAPQLNIFSLGFPLTLLMGVVIVKIGLPAVVAQMTDSIEFGMTFIMGMLH